jgi:hypothetical protein
MNDQEIALLAEQLKRAIDRLHAEGRLSAQRLDALEKAAADHEARLRAVTDGVTQFKVWSGLTAGGSGLMALLAFLRSFLG